MSIPQFVDGETDLDSITFNRIVNRVNAITDGTAPIALAGIEGALGAYGPLKKIVSADWYSDLNDAVAAVGTGGVLQLTPETTYAHTSGDPILLTPGITFECVGTPALITTTGPGFAVSDPSVRHRNVRLAGFNIVASSGDIGIDWRGFTHGEIDSVICYGFSDCGIWFGGDNPDYESSWTHTVRRSEFLADQDGARFSGTTGAGAPTANNISFYDSVVFVGENSGSYGVNLIEGDTNLFQHCDIGYSASADGIAIMLGHKSWVNTFLANRCEDVPASVRTVSGASRNKFIGNTLGATNVLEHPVELVSGTEYFAFFANSYSSTSLAPYVDVQSGATNHRVFDNSADGDRRPHAFATNVGGDAVLESRVIGDANRRFVLTAAGALLYVDPATGSFTSSWGQQATGQVGPSDNSTMIRISNYTALPSASSARRGDLVRIDGGTGVADGVYICVKDAADSYSWKAVTLV